MATKKTVEKSSEFVSKPRKVVINPSPEAEGVIYTTKLIPLVDMCEVEYYILGSGDNDRTFVINVRDEIGCDPITPYGLFLGYANTREFIPEIIIDEKGAYVLVFHRISK